MSCFFNKFEFGDHSFKKVVFKLMSMKFIIIIKKFMKIIGIIQENQL